MGRLRGKGRTKRQGETEVWGDQGTAGETERGEEDRGAWVGLEDRRETEGHGGRLRSMEGDGGAEGRLRSSGEDMEGRRGDRGAVGRR